MSGMSHEVQADFASLFALSDKLLVRRSALRSPFYLGEAEKTTGAAASANNAGDDACFLLPARGER